MLQPLLDLGERLKEYFKFVAYTSNIRVAVLLDLYLLFYSTPESCFSATHYTYDVPVLYLSVSYIHIIKFKIFMHLATREFLRQYLIALLTLDS